MPERVTRAFDSARNVVDVTSTVFGTNDDISVRESFSLLITTAGWRPEAFASTADIGIELRNCPAYIREWVDQERVQTPSGFSDDSAGR